MKQVTLLSILLLFTFHSFAQIHGKIIDTDKNPIAYANIQIKTKGTISNEEGNFEIKTSNFNPKDSVHISFLGYKTLKMTIKDFVSKNYVLEESINDLSEVEVSKKNYTLDEILTKIKERIDSNYVTSNYKLRIFNRSTYYNKFRNFEFEIKKATLLSRKARKEVNKSLEGFFNKNENKASKSYLENLAELYNFNKKNKLKVIKATKLIDKAADKSADKLQKEILNVIAKHLEKGATYKVNSGIFPVEDSLKIDNDFNKSVFKDSLKLENTRNYLSNRIKSYNLNNKTYDFIHKPNRYNYTLKGFSTLDNEKIYVIDFNPKKSAAKYKGTLHVNAYDFAVVKLKYGYAKGKEFSKNLNFLLGVKMAQSKNNVEVIFKKNFNDLYALKFIKQETASYAYVNRSLRFRKNRKDKSEDKRMIKMEFLLELDNSFKDEFFITEENDITKQEFDQYKEPKKYKINYISSYSPETWKGYNVISPIQEIKDYGNEE